MSDGLVPLLDVRSIRASYGPIEVIHDVSLKVYPGKVTALLGPNGGGKTTLVNVCAGVHQPDQGEVWFEGDNVTKVSAGARSRRGICTVPEGRGVFPNLTVRENVLVAAEARRRWDRSVKPVPVTRHRAGSDGWSIGTINFQSDRP